MIKRLILFIFLFSFQNLIAQDSLSHIIEKWVEQEEHLRDIDLSSGFFHENCSLLGIFGSNNYKLNIRFDSVSLSQINQIYYVEGRSLLNDKITSFKGELAIQHIELLDIDQMWLVVSGSYNLVEEGGGVFKGLLKKYLSYDSKVYNKAIFEDIDAEVGNKEGFAGVWIDPNNHKQYRCLFGFHRYPQSLAQDFDRNGGEPLINVKFKEYGWKTWFEIRKGYSFYSNTDCEDDWWK